MYRIKKNHHDMPKKIKNAWKKNKKNQLLNNPKLNNKFKITI
jgi:hypothetical protein